MDPITSEMVGMAIHRERLETGERRRQIAAAAAGKGDPRMRLGRLLILVGTRLAGNGSQESPHAGREPVMLSATAD